MAKVTAGKTVGKKGKLRRLIIEVAHNGATSKMEHEPERGKDGYRVWDQPEEKPMVHPKLKHLVDHVKAAFASHFHGTETAPGSPLSAEPGEGDNDEDDLAKIGN